MVKREEILGTAIIQYEEEISEFVDALEKSETKRVYTYTTLNLLDSNCQAAFVDDEGTVHGFVTYKFENLEERLMPMGDMIEKKRIPEIDGMIKVSQRNGDIYQVFQTENTTYEEAVQTSYDEWIEAVKELPAEETLIQYLIDEDMTVIDATKGKEHLITILDGEVTRTLEDTLNLLMGHGKYKTRDNKDVIIWYKDMQNR